MLPYLYFCRMNLTHWWQLLFYGFCLITGIQIFYYLFFFSRLALYKSRPKTSLQTHPVSVIICARDEAANLAKNLPGVLVQKYPTSHEVIVVDDNSFDESKYFLEELQKSFKQLHIIELKQEAQFIPGKKFPLSIGIKTAKYEIVLLTDADCVPASEHWIQLMQQSFDDKTEIVLGYGAYHKKKGLLNKIIRWETFHTALQYFSFALAGSPYMGVGRNLSYKKSIFFRHKGFTSHNHVPSGDDDLFINMAATKKNTRINIHPDAFTQSKPSETWKQWIKQKHRHYSTGKFNKPKHQILLGLYSLSYFMFYPLLISVILFYNWQYAGVVYIARLFVQAIVLYPCMKKLKENSLYPALIFIDIGMFFYYMLFTLTLIKKPRPAWK